MEQKEKDESVPEPLKVAQLNKLLATKSLSKSQVMHSIFSFLNKGHVLQL